MLVLLPMSFIISSPALASAAGRCVSQSSTSVLAAKSSGDIYNQLTLDGNELPASYFVKAEAIQPSYAYSVQVHESAYDTQHEGSFTHTVVHTIGGQTISVPWFVATERTAEARVAHCIGLAHLYAGIGFMQAFANYGYPLGYSDLRGVGIGLERFPIPSRRFDIFGSLYWYPVAVSAYGGTHLFYTNVTFDAGIRWLLGSSKVAFIAGLYQEKRFPHSGTRAGFLENTAPYIGLESSFR